MIGLTTVKRSKARASRSLLVAVLVSLGCNTAAVTGPGGTSDRGGGGGSSPPSAAGPGFVIPDAGAADAAAVTPPPMGETCASVSETAKPVGLDLLLLLDASGSMADRAGTRTRWELAREALAGFLRSDRAAGLGVGVQLFPVHRPCQDDGTCFLFAPGACKVLSACLAPNGPLIAGSPCGALDDLPCPIGTTCTPLGRCSMSGGDCVGMGQPCASGVANDVCGPRMGQCRFGPRTRGSCEVADYSNATVPIVELPAGAARLIGAVDTRVPVGGTPLGPALKGALAALRAHAQAHPDRRVALVIVSDGVPQGCGDVPSIVADLSAASAGTPRIPTYVVAVLADTDPPAVRATVGTMATAGGTGMPFIVTANEQLGEKFLFALDQIRGAALPCEYPIPRPMNQPLDFGKVNVRVTSGGTPADLVYVEGADRCGATRGWYYDVAPSTGSPARVLLCPAVCDQLRADPKAAVELIFGCRSRTVE